MIGMLATATHSTSPSERRRRRKKMMVEEAWMIMMPVVSWGVRIIMIGDNEKKKR